MSSGQNYVSKVFVIDFKEFNNSLHEALFDAEFKALNLQNNSKTQSSIPLSSKVSLIEYNA